MASNLVLLSFKPGIQRDGSKFQGDMCSDGQWVRFQRGTPKKIGGIRAIINYARSDYRAKNLLLTPSGGVNSSYLYLADNLRVFRTSVDNNLMPTQGFTAISPLSGWGEADILWESTIVIRNNVRNVVFLKTTNARDITQTATSTIYSGVVESADGAQLLPTALPLNATGGMCYSAPYLFLYGTAGYVGYSRTDDPLNFVGGTSGELNPITSDKVIFGANIRGGSAAPSLLFWTLSSVVKVSNIGDQAVLFKNEVLSTKSSILSSRCVIEYDGLFFWPGTKRFFIYNGVINTMKNTMNLNYFYKNLDMSKRQLVFGLLKEQFNEMWWFYPEIANQGDATIGCTRAIVYNKEDNFWYDTAISMDCGVNYDTLGATITYGKSLVNPSIIDDYIWVNETGTNQVIMDGTPPTPIPSSFTTPIFSWASPFSPARPPGTKGQPTDRWIELRSMEPDFVMDNDTDEMQIRVNTKNYAQSPVVTSAPITFTRLTEKVDIRAQGRHMSLTFTSTRNFEMGNVQMLVGIGDGR